MCLTVPRKVTKVEGKKALLQDGRWVSTAMIGVVKPGDMVLAQANLAVEKVSKTQARAMKDLVAED